MSHASRWLRFLGAWSLAGLALAQSASITQAESGSSWFVNGEIVSSSLFPFVHISYIDGKHLVLLTKVGSSKVEILCTEATLLNSILGESGSYTGVATFLNCKTLLNGSTAAACTPNFGEIRAEFKGLIVLHETIFGSKETLTRLEPSAGSAFTTVSLGSLCAIGNKFPITGKFFLRDGNGEFSKETTTHLVLEGLLSALLFGSNAATIDGSVVLGLDFNHWGMTWSGLPS